MLIRGDARRIPLRDATVQCVVTSPPYFQLRDYGVQEIGNEATPEAYVAALLEVFREVRRVLRDDGVLWLVLGDSAWGTTSRQRATRHPVLKLKDLIGLPWRVALALQADGWYLRADVIWGRVAPGNCSPEAPTDPDLRNSRIRLFGPRTSLHDGRGKNARRRKRIAPQQPMHSCPRYPRPLRAAAQPLPPHADDLELKVAEHPQIADNTKIPEVPE
jgi:hypothetical protein